MVLPSGDHVLVVHVHHHTHPQGTGALGTQGGPGAAAPHSSCSAPGDAVKFVVELPTAAQGGSGGGAVLPVVRSEYSESSEETSRHSAAPGEAVPQYPDVPTPGVTPESSAIYASHRSPEYSLQMALHRAAQVRLCPAPLTRLRHQIIYWTPAVSLCLSASTHHAHASPR